VYSGAPGWSAVPASIVKHVDGYLIKICQLWCFCTKSNPSIN